MEHFEKLYQVNVNEYTEEKNGLTYLSWANAWAEVKKIYPDAQYTIKRFENGLPYVYDEKTGYMVFTDVTIEGLTYEMWLPVMDGANKAMKAEPYKYVTKYGEKTVEAATMFDINKTIMRCLVKNLAMFGLGLYIYAGEDLPEDLSKEKTEDKIVDIVQLRALQAIIKEYAEKKELKLDDVEANILKTYNLECLNDVTESVYANILNKIKNAK